MTTDGAGVLSWVDYLTAAEGDVNYVNVTGDTMTGWLVNNVDARAPRFYDSDNTSFFLDPAAISLLNDVRASILQDRDNAAFFLDPAGSSVLNTVSKSAGSFEIPHPDPAKAQDGWKLRHSFVESPTRGDNLYRFSVTVEGGVAMT